MPNTEQKNLITCADKITRCYWVGHHEDYHHYHDNEWGYPIKDDFKLFEKICLEGFQSGLSWITILRKRENFRIAFANFNFNQIANFNDYSDIETLLLNKGIVRHRGKIKATINNAKKAIDLVNEFGSLAKYIWQWEPKEKEPDIRKDNNKTTIPSITKTSKALSEDLKKRGWQFFGPTTAYAFMQAVGLVNDHIPGCHCYMNIETTRSKFKRP